jgi:hypothetical protein
MKMDTFRALFRAPAPPRVELVLFKEDGARWVLNVSPGIEKFIGSYPRLEGIKGTTPLLVYHKA